MLERRIYGQKDKRRVYVREHEDHSEGTVKEKLNRMMDDVKVLQKAIQHSVAAENRFPGVTSDEVTDPEWNDDKLVEQVFAHSRAERSEERRVGKECRSRR